jgi:hypothetical protein
MFLINLTKFEVFLDPFLFFQLFVNNIYLYLSFSHSKIKSMPKQLFKCDDWQFFNYHLNVHLPKRTVQNFSGKISHTFL